MRDRIRGQIDLRRLSQRRASPIEWVAAREDLDRLVGRLGLLSAESVALRGEIAPGRDGGFVLEALLQARVEQACVSTLEPVPTAIETGVLRRYVPDLAMPEGGEHESPEDDSVEPLPDRIDLAEIAAEALSLALPDYPRAQGAPCEVERAAGAGDDPGDFPDGGGPARDGPNRPFAGLDRRIGASAGADPHVPGVPPRKGAGGG